MPPVPMFAYKTLPDAPRLRVSHPRLDGARNDALLPRDGIVDLYSIEGRWRRVRLRANVRLPADRIIGLLDDPDAHRVVVTVHCPSTNLRHAVVVSPDPGRPGSYSGEVELERELLHDRASIEAVVAGTVDGVKGRYLARSESIDVRISELRLPDISGDLDIAWASFDEQAEGVPLIDAANHDQLSHLELERAEGPRLWLNESVEGLHRLLHAPHRDGTNEAMRLAVFDGIATSAMVAMFNAAMAEARERRDQGSDSWPEDWRGQLLRSLLPLMYPDRDADDALIHMLDTQQDGEGMFDVQQRAHAAVARLMKTNANASRAVKALEEDLA